MAALDAVFCPRPRVWSSAVVFLLLALGLSVVVPGSTHSSVSVSNGFFALVDESGIAINTSLVERPRERWNVDVTWNRGQGNGRMTAAVQTKVVRRVGPDDVELAPPTQEEVDAVLLAWAEQERADPLLADAIRNGGSIVRWDSRGVAAVVGRWVMFLLVAIGFVLVIGRSAVKRYFEKCIAAWHDGK